MFPGIRHKGNELFDDTWREGKKERRMLIHREDETTEDAFSVRARLLVFGEWFSWLSKFRKTLWSKGFSQAFKGKTATMACNAETSFLNHVDKILCLRHSEMIRTSRYLPQHLRGVLLPWHACACRESWSELAPLDEHSACQYRQQQGHSHPLFYCLPCPSSCRYILGAGMPSILHPYQTSLSSCLLWQLNDILQRLSQKCR